MIGPFRSSNVTKSACTLSRTCATSNTVNVKRVCDESSTVLNGIGELITGVAKIQAELVKGKTCVEVKERIEQVLTKGDTMLTRFNQVMEPIKKRWNHHGHFFPKPKDSVNVVTKSKEEIVRITTQTSAQNLKDPGVPVDLCWCWFVEGLPSKLLQILHQCLVLFNFCLNIAYTYANNTDVDSSRPQLSSSILV